MYPSLRSFEKRTVFDIYRERHFTYWKESFMLLVSFKGGHWIVGRESNRNRTNASRKVTIKTDRLKRGIEQALKYSIELDKEEDEMYGPDCRGDEQPEGLRTPAERRKRFKEAKRKIKNRRSDGG